MNWGWFYFGSAAASAIAHTALLVATLRTRNGTSWLAWRAKLVGQVALSVLMAAQVARSPGQFHHFDPLTGPMAVALLYTAFPTWVLMRRIGKH